MFRILALTCTVIAAVIVMTAAVTSAVKPPDLTCVTWKKWSYGQPTPPINELFVPAQGWVIGAVGDCDICEQRGSLLPCFADGPRPSEQTWGHHDYLAYYIESDFCRIYRNDTGTTYFATEFYLGFKGAQWKTWRYKLAQTGGSVPPHAIRLGSRVMAMSTMNAPGCCAGIGFGGWAEAHADDKFGDVHFSIQSAPFTTTTFKVAVCASQPTTTTLPPTTTEAPTTEAPTTTRPTPSPTLPPSNKPYVRVAHAVPTNHKFTFTISQGTITKTWTCKDYRYFSPWSEIFHNGNGQIAVTDCTTGKLVINSTRLLTPGPLIVTIKGTMPIDQFSLETIAASYVPAEHGMSGVRLFNLCPDCVSAGLKADGKTLVDGVKFSIGSIWAPIRDDVDYTFTVFDDQTSKQLASDKFEAPSSPFVFTNFLLGLRNGTGIYATSMISLVDAPEF